MEFIKIAYCVTIPLLVLFSWAPDHPLKKYSANLLAVSDLLLIGHSFFLAWQLISAYQLAKTFSVDYLHSFDHDPELLVRLMLIVLLPLLFLHRYFRGSRIFALVMVVLLYSVFPFSSWNTYDLVYKIPAYLCLLCAAYALLWLLNKLPYQSPVR